MSVAKQILKENYDKKAVERLKALIDEFTYVMSNSPGHTTSAITIDAGTTPPFRTPPYYLYPAWRQQVKDEINTLLPGGIVEPCTSPWSSPIVPVKKSDGSIRLCVEYRV